MVSEKNSVSAESPAFELPAAGGSFQPLDGEDVSSGQVVLASLQSQHLSRPNVAPPPHRR